MSLFTKLRQLASEPKNGLEDFHTEIVGQVLRNAPVFTLKWLNNLGVTEIKNADSIFIETQAEYKALEAHQNVGSRPDIEIRVQKASIEELIFVESKIGSKEGHNQLQRYADHLSKANAAKRSLIYITRDFEPKQPPKSTNVTFYQCRWFDFYRLLNCENQPGDLMKELTTFMKENDMSQSNQFSSIDVLALSNFQKARKIMDKTMWDGISQKFYQRYKQERSPAHSMTQFKNHNRYAMFASFGTRNEMEVLLGYWMPDEALTAYPEIGAEINVKPSAPSRSKIVSAMRDFERFKRGKWKCYGLSNEREWGSMSQFKSLQDFLSEKDHIKKVTDYFDSLITDLAEFQTKYTKLPWNPGLLGNDVDQ